LLKEVDLHPQMNIGFSLETLCHFDHCDKQDKTRDLMLEVARLVLTHCEMALSELSVLLKRVHLFERAKRLVVLLLYFD